MRRFRNHKGPKMSATKPYFFDEDSPSRLKKLVIRYPCTIGIYRNIVHKKPVSENVFIDTHQSLVSDDDPLIEFIIDELCNQGLLLREEGQLYNLYSDLVLASQSFSNDEVRSYSYNVLSQAQAALQFEPSKPVKGGYFIGSLTEEDFSRMIEGVQNALNETRNKPDGEIKYLATFFCKQI